MASTLMAVRDVALCYASQVLDDKAPAVAGRHLSVGMQRAFSLAVSLLS